jgi:hypothetical protein
VSSVSSLAQGRSVGWSPPPAAMGVEAHMMHWQSFIYGASAMAIAVLVIELVCWWFRRQK